MATAKRLSLILLHTFTQSFQKHCEKRRQATDELLKTSDVIAKPFIKIHQYNWCRGVQLCIPIEVLNENDVNELANIAKKTHHKTNYHQ